MIMPYLNFEGNCEEAFRWYKEVFDGKLMHLVKYSDIPEEFRQFELDEQEKNKVMHAQLMLTETGGISGSDALLPIEKGRTVFLHAHLSNEENAQEIFAALSESGTILSELALNPPPDDSGISGSLKDRYGFIWIISSLVSK